MGTRRVALELLPAQFELAEDEDAPTHRQLRFAQEYARSKDPKASLAAAGYKPNSTALRQRLWGFKKDPVVARLVSHISLAIEKTANVGAAWLLTEMAQVAKANILDFIQIDPETGEVSVDPRTWKREDAKAIERLVITNNLALDGTVKSQTIQIRMVSKVGIYKIIGEHVDIAAFKEDQLRERGNEIAERLARAAERVAAYQVSVKQLPAESGEQGEGENGEEHNEVEDPSGCPDGPVGSPAGSELPDDDQRDPEVGD